ncbi:THO complex subunit 4A isoform X1 [Zea mays]|uniref:RRM domain-containing protein n=2 Tax=Zea mays TaxID=4577 RepID=B4FUT7_MAIZE|nr:uncharacterized protein LOC100272743 isoform X1 [Zea mays]XP_020399126.1 uncharacterized protein LOC100272743 isoform X1 [Zea mays]XP_020399127.1 uncharacterized protein LOC100272743 isoform X1 [Zea mays]XP_035818036.1 uncharacterized protein LOC100272743 isoform X1 [Zea mays]ACF85880.1 unknown [Zea mays]|eukprot:XP_008658242.1 uncharacterized protein LOC100272743 isoform X1 [Zea mays]
MAETLDMTLDDIIKNNKKSNPSSRGARRSRGVSAPGGGTGGVGPTRRPFKRAGNRQAPYQPPKAPDAAWQHDMYPAVAAGGGGGGGRVSALETGAKLYISNLDFGVSNEDIKELFSELGDLKRFSINYDRSGRSKGTAEVVFARRSDAVAAVKKYDNVQLDGKPMKIEIVGTNTPAAAAAHPVPNGGHARNAARSAPKDAAPAGMSQHRTHQRGGRRAAGSGGGRRGKERSKPKSTEELDADLEKYHADAMQTN